MRVALASLILGAQLVAACSTLAPLPQAERQYAGRFSVVTTLAGKRDTGTGRFTLAVEGEAIALDLASPLGTTLARIEVNGSGAHLTAPGDSGLREVHGADAEALTYEVLGWPLPVEGIGDWIRGRPAPGRPFRERTAGSGAEAFDQDGWTVSVLDRFADDRGTPRLVLLERPESPGLAPAISLRLVLDEPPVLRQAG